MHGTWVWRHGFCTVAGRDVALQQRGEQKGKQEVPRLRGAGSSRAGACARNSNEALGASNTCPPAAAPPRWTPPDRALNATFTLTP